jgi:hypothetical protein
MENDEPLSTQNLYEIIKDEELRHIKIITSPLNIGVILFFGVVLFLFLNGNPESTIESIDTSLVDLMLMLSLGLTALMVYVSRIVSNSVFRKGSESLLNLKVRKDSISRNLIELVTTHYIIKFAMLEGAALFGLVSLILSVLNKAIYYDEKYWLAVIRMLVMNFIYILNFPSKDRVIQLINEKIIAAQI